MCACSCGGARMHMPRRIQLPRVRAVATGCTTRCRGLRPQASADSDLTNQFQTLMSEIARQLQQQAAPIGSESGTLQLSGVWYQPAGCEYPLLRDINLQLPPNSLGIVYGPSGSGKTTLLQLLAGLRQPTAGSVSITHTSGAQAGRPQVLDAAGRQQACGLVFQFPERHFVGSNIITEMVLGWPNKPEFHGLAQQLSYRLPAALVAVKIEGFPLTTDPSTLSDGYKRRLALAVQLVRQPAILLLDEPLAGLDWRARADLVKLLQSLKSQCSLLIISHDLRELAPIVDRAWKMLPGGSLEAVSATLPVPKLLMADVTSRVLP